MKKIAILIPIFNGLNYTRKCLDFIASELNSKELKENFFTIVIDDGSTDGSAEWIQTNHTDVIILQGDGNLWWGGSANKGIQYVIDEKLADYILLWNNDVKACDLYFTILQEKAIQIDKMTIVGSKVYFLDKPEMIWSMGGYFNTLTGAKDMLGRGEFDQEKYNKVYEADWLPGMGTLVPTKVFEDIGMIDTENFQQVHGDSDFTFRAKKEGIKLIVDPDLKMYNDKSQTSILHQNKFKMLLKSFTYLNSNFNIKKDLKFYKKHTSNPLAYSALFIKYGRYIGGFYKWKVLNFLGIRKKT